MLDESLDSYEKYNHMDQYTTFFSTREWADCWSRVFTNDRVFEVAVHGSGPARKMHFIQTRSSYGISDLSSGYSHDFCVSPGWQDSLDNSTVRQIIDQLPWSLIRSFTWKVRFDHVDLAKALAVLKLQRYLIRVHILDLDR